MTAAARPGTPRPGAWSPAERIRCGCGAPQRRPASRTVNLMTSGRLPSGTRRPGTPALLAGKEAAPRS